MGKTIKKSQMYYDFFGKNKASVPKGGGRDEEGTDNMIYNISFD